MPDRKNQNPSPEDMVSEPSGLSAEKMANRYSQFIERLFNERHAPEATSVVTKREELASGHRKPTCSPNRSSNHVLPMTEFARESLMYGTEVAHT